MKNMHSQPLLFLGLCLSALAGAQPGVTLFVTTDMDCNWKLDGRPMDLLNADHPKVVPVTLGEHLIEASTTDGVATIRTTINTANPTRIDVEMGKFWVAIDLKNQHDRQLNRQHAETAREPAEADVALNPTWTDPATGLLWTRKDNGADADWNQASAYCANLQLAGLSGWRLPTIEELQGIYDPSVSIKTEFDYGVINVHVKGNLKLTGWQWSSAQGEAPGKPWQVARDFIFHQGTGEQNTFPLGFSYSMRALCVRRSRE